MLGRLARSCYRHRRVVVLVWLVALVGVTLVSNRLGDDYRQSFHLAGTDSQAATDLLDQRFQARSGSTADVVFAADAGVHDPAVEQGMTSLFATIGGIDHVVAVRGPYTPDGALQVSPDGRISFAEVQFDQPENLLPSRSVHAVAAAVDQARATTSGVQIELGGGLFANREPPSSSEMIGLLAAVAILLIAFGSLLAMGLPILTAMFGLGVGLASVSVLSHVMSVPDFTTQLAAMIGIGVGIDYALFIVTRYRQGLHDGFGPEEAVVTAIDTAGRAVLFAGCTVVISLGGMLLMGVSFIRGLAIGAAVVVAITMVTSVTLLPAVLGFVGHNIDRLSIPGLRHNAESGRRGFWFSWSRFLQSHPWSSAIAAFLLLLALAVPALSIRLGSSDEGNAPTTETTRRAYDLKAEAFGAGADAPLLLAADLPPGTTTASLEPLAAVLSTTPGVAYVSPPQANAAGDAAIMEVVPTTSSQSAATVELIHTLRNQVIPQATAGTGVSVHVGGMTAVFDDLAEQLQSRLPVFIGAVLALSFLLLLVVFRSVLVPLKAVIMNLLSISAAYGVVVAVFQWGWFGGLFGVGKTGPVEAFLPMMMFAILFGLSMDYEVFLLSRIKEEYDRTGDNTTAVADGLSLTARVITAAAAIMITVFGSFIFGDLRVIKEFGLGLAVAIFIDATIVRMLLVPATMELLGKANWWLPSWLGWLPHINIEGHEVPGPPVTTPVPVEFVPVPDSAAEVETERPREPVTTG